jgi:voltage-gated potassium channel
MLIKPNKMTYGSVDVDPLSPLQPLLEANASNNKVETNAALKRSSLAINSANTRRSVLKTIVSRRVIEAPGVSSQDQKQDDDDDDHHHRHSPCGRCKSFLYTMLNPRSSAWQAVIFKWFITMVIVADLIGFILSTEPNLTEPQQRIFSTWEAVTSYIFLSEYILRLITVTESHKYGSMGPIMGRLRYCITGSALIDLVATAPYFLERFTGWDLPTLTYVRSFRLLRILKTESFSEASKSVYRVFKYNSEILYVALCIGVGMVLFTSVLMYYTRPKDHEQFQSLSSTIYLSTLMLTGQGGPDGQLPWYTSAVVLLTGVFSIGMFAIPASMLTWGFEG